jgi:hypothetical protein
MKPNEYETALPPHPAPTCRAETQTHQHVAFTFCLRRNSPAETRSPPSRTIINNLGCVLLCQRSYTDRAIIALFGTSETKAIDTKQNRCTCKTSRRPRAEHQPNLSRYYFLLSTRIQGLSKLQLGDLEFDPHIFVPVCSHMHEIRIIKPGLNKRPCWKSTHLTESSSQRSDSDIRASSHHDSSHDRSALSGRLMSLRRYAECVIRCSRV